MLGSDFKGHQVTQVLCEELLPIAAGVLHVDPAGSLHRATTSR